MKRNSKFHILYSTFLLLIVVFGMVPLPARAALSESQRCHTTVAGFRFCLEITGINPQNPEFSTNFTATVNATGQGGQNAVTLNVEWLVNPRTDFSGQLNVVGNTQVNIPAGQPFQRTLTSEFTASP